MVTRQVPVVDGHNDLAWEARFRRGYSLAGIDEELPQTLQTDIPKLRRGGVAGQFWSAWVHSDLQGGEAVIATLEQIDFIHRMIARYPETFRFASDAESLRGAHAAGRIASLIGIEGGHQVAGSLAVLRQYARLGVRYMTLTWNRSTDFADAAVGERLWNGLNDLGRQVVAEMNAIGMLVDLSHVSADTMRDALDASSRPLVFSHSSSFSVNPHPRNVPEDVQRLLAANGGVQMITFVPSFVSRERWQWEQDGAVGEEPPVTVRDVADHVDQARDVMGVEHVGLGGDFDGSASMPRGLDDVGRYPGLFAELSERGWSDADLERLGWLNIVRVLEENDAAYRAFMAHRGDAVGGR